MPLSAAGADDVSAGQGKEITLTVFCHFTPQEARGVTIRDFIDQYNKQHAGQVNIKLSYFADFAPMQQKIRTMVGANQPPDIFYFNYNPNDLALFQSGQLMDFAPYMDAQWKQRFYQSDLDQLTVSGKLLAIPMEQGPVVFYYNKALLKKAGVSGIPATWDDFFVMAEKLKSIGVAAASLFTADDAWHAMNFFSYFAAEKGGQNIFAANNSLNSPAVIEGATMLQKLFRYAAPDAIGGKWAVSVQDFIAERTAVLVDGPWVIGMLDQQMKTADQVEAAPAPKFSKGDPAVIITDALTPWAASNHLSKTQKNAVADFMKAYTSEAVMKQFAIQGKDIFAVKMNLNASEQAQAGLKLADNIRLASEANQKVVQVTRVIKPATMNQLPSLVEKLALFTSTPKEFAQALQQYNAQ
jgi:raffinose/stachyose/melibiose transport system substrate-binding protein